MGFFLEIYFLIPQILIRKFVMELVLPTVQVLVLLLPIGQGIVHSACFLS